MLYVFHIFIYNGRRYEIELQFCQSKKILKIKYFTYIWLYKYYSLFFFFLTNDVLFFCGILLQLYAITLVVVCPPSSTQYKIENSKMVFFFFTACSRHQIRNHRCCMQPSLQQWRAVTAAFNCTNKIKPLGRNIVIIQQ